MYHIAICEDDSVLRNQIVQTLSTHPRREDFVLHEFEHGEDLLANLQSGASYLLLILDIEMGAVNGVTLGTILRQELKDPVTQILYISAYDSYAMELFNVQPLNFLKKPLDPDQLFSCVTQVLEFAPALDATLTFFFSKQAKRVLLREIRYLESYHRKLTIHTLRGDFISSQRLSELRGQLPYPTFFQIHQSFMVNDRYVRHIQYDKLTMDNGLELSISQAYRREVRDLLFHGIPQGRPIHN